MGGNAIKNAVTRRYESTEYHELEKQVLQQFKTDFPNRRIEAIKAYRTKESFGDMDLLFESDDLNIDIKEYITNTFTAKEIVKNGHVYSFEHLEFQIDLILVSRKEFETSASYFAWNDLGNLCGRLSQSMGLKLGHDGLSYSWVHETYKFDEILLLTDWADILPVLGLDYQTWASGFDTIEDIFKFTTNSKFFNKDLYLLHNRNHTSRVRDAKRKTYMDFLDWIQDDAKSLPNHPYKENKDDWLPYLFSVIPNFESQYNDTQRRFVNTRLVKEKYNGKLVLEISGRSNKELSSLMMSIKDSFENNELFQAWVLKSTDDEIKQFIMEMHNKQ
jgi:hypothetical protein